MNNRKIKSQPLLKGISISLARLLGEEMVENRPYFNYAPRREPRRSLSYQYRGFTRVNRYPKLNAFLQRHKRKIKVFAEISAANANGAPSAVEAKQILGKGAVVYAVDVYKESVPLNRFGVREKLQAIQKQPLRHNGKLAQFDAVRWGNTSRYMLRREVVKTMDNLWHSLKIGGVLLGGTQINDYSAHPPGNEEHQFILMKISKTKQNPSGFVEIFPNELKE